jgi:hypothetical protein
MPVMLFGQLYSTLQSAKLVMLSSLDHKPVLIWRLFSVVSLTPLRCLTTQSLLREGEDGKMEWIEGLGKTLSEVS